VSAVRFRNVLFDFDGVLAETNQDRTEGFRAVLSSYPADQVNALVAFHEANGGLSRYAKFRHFFRTIRAETVDEGRITELAEAFSRAVKQRIVKAPWVPGALEFITNGQTRRLFVVSGSDQTELRWIIEERGAARYFVECVGSPVEKAENVGRLIDRHWLSPRHTVLVGDSRTDWEAAQANAIAFIARRSGQQDWAGCPVPVIDTLFELEGLV
jgi:phosphoglycolate phosphatase-like HAD superfamily hydrolase